VWGALKSDEGCQAPVDRSQFGVDAPYSIDSEVERTLDAVDAGLGDRLSGLVGTAGGVARGLLEIRRGSKRAISR
jgi:hypothetical protein